MGQRICIIGGSGFVGSAIVRQAVQAGHEVRVACRHPERARELLVDGASLVQADVVDGRGIAEAVAGADCVIYLVGLLFEKGRQNFEAAHVGGVARVLEACKQAGVKQYLHMSALGAGNVPESRYAETKAKAEALVRESGLNWTIFRPSVIYGAGDDFFNKFKAMTALMPVLPVISGDSYFQPVWVEDVARAFVKSVGNAHVSRESFDLGGPERYSFRELLELMLHVLGRKRILLPLPGIAAKAMAIFGAALPTPPITLDQLKLLAHDNTVEGDPFPELFGEPACLEIVLPSYLAASLTELRQAQMDSSRKHYRQGGM